MGLYRKMLKGKSRIYDNFLTNPKVVKICTFLALFVWFFALIAGYIVAQFDPDGYNIFHNMISDMGSFNHTPLPYFLDYGAMITAILMIPASFYMEKTIAPSPINKGVGEFPRMMYRLSGCGAYHMFMGIFGFFMIGLFSEDRSTPLRLHWIFSHVVFFGLIMGTFFYGLLILFYKTDIPRLLGLYMVVVTFITGIILIATYVPFWEWMMLLTLMIRMVPVNAFLVKNMGKE